MEALSQIWHLPVDCLGHGVATSGVYVLGCGERNVVKRVTNPVPKAAATGILAVARPVALVSEHAEETLLSRKPIENYFWRSVRHCHVISSLTTKLASFRPPPDPRPHLLRRHHPAKHPDFSHPPKQPESIAQPILYSLDSTLPLSFSLSSSARCLQIFGMLPPKVLFIWLVS